MAYASDQLSAGAFISAAPRQHCRQGRFPARGSPLQVAKKLLQQRAVIRAELAILTEYNGSVCVRGRELKVTD